MISNAEFSLYWQSPGTEHTERRLIRTIFLSGQSLTYALEGIAPGKSGHISFEPGVLSGPWRKDRVQTLRLSPGGNLGSHGLPVAPKQGRFYPRRLIPELTDPVGKPEVPLRILEVDGDRITVDLNHPLSPYAVEMDVTIHGPQPGESQAGATGTESWTDKLIQGGPGMQAPFHGIRTDFRESTAFTRIDPRPDAEFYRAPRRVGHVDSRASGFIRDIYGGRLNQGNRVLDLMSSYQCHLPEDKDLHVTGLGMNREEMDSNAMIDELCVQDLNEETRIPFPDASFDGVVCSLSVEYLVHPMEVFHEAARVLKPGAPFLLSFSNRWFPPKVTRLWTLLHPYERMAWLLQLFEDTNRFGRLFTTTVHGWPRPVHDPHYPKSLFSDPIFVVGGIRN